MSGILETATRTATGTVEVVDADHPGLSQDLNHSDGVTLTCVTVSVKTGEMP